MWSCLLLGCHIIKVDSGFTSFGLKLIGNVIWFRQNLIPATSRRNQNLCFFMQDSICPTQWAPCIERACLATDAS
jgi:hypothetical protein